MSQRSGLGKNENGMKEAIKVKIKNDSHGVGHNRGDEFTFHWWDHVFNKAASSIVVESTQGATLDNNQEVKSEGEEEGALEVTEYLEEDRQTLQKLPDEEILKICGGMTAHKGARHGLKLNGKLERIQEQERLLMEKWKKQKGSNSQMDKSERSSLSAKTDTTTENEDVNRECVKTKKKKKKRDKYEDAEKISQNQSPDCDDSQEIQNDKSDVKKEKKRKWKNIELGHETEIDHETKRTKKKKKRDRNKKITFGFSEWDGRVRQAMFSDIELIFIPSVVGQNLLAFTVRIFCSFKENG
uniref:G patch domain-containing protein 4 n=1 Tax=Magallana gigas TaxID=29159 RepID=K1R135_MAGGI